MATSKSTRTKPEETKPDAKKPEDKKPDANKPAELEIMGQEPEPKKKSGRIQRLKQLMVLRPEADRKELAKLLDGEGYEPLAVSTLEGYYGDTKQTLRILEEMGKLKE